MSVTSLTLDREIRHEEAAISSSSLLPVFGHARFLPLRSSSFARQFSRINSLHLRRARQTGEGRNPRRRLSIEGHGWTREFIIPPAVGVVIDWKPVIHARHDKLGAVGRVFLSFAVVRVSDTFRSSSRMIHASTATLDPGSGVSGWNAPVCLDRQSRCARMIIRVTMRSARKRRKWETSITFFNSPFILSFLPRLGAFNRLYASTDVWVTRSSIRSWNASHRIARAERRRPYSCSSRYTSLVISGYWSPKAPAWRCPSVSTWIRILVVIVAARLNRPSAVSTTVFESQRHR